MRAKSLTEFIKTTAKNRHGKEKIMDAVLAKNRTE
jgi:hypothetical protein